MGALIRAGQPLKILLSHHPLLKELYGERKRTLYREGEVSNHVFQQDLLSLLLCSESKYPETAANRVQHKQHQKQLLRPNLKRNCQKTQQFSLRKQKSICNVSGNISEQQHPHKVLSFCVILSTWICHSFTAVLH